jgi:carboxylesterase
MPSRLPRVSKSAYHLKGTGPQVLLFHGLTGSPYDLRPLANSLHARGASVQVPLLKGHGTKIEDLRAVSAQNWLDQGRSLLKKCDQDRPIILGGLSMGALIAIVLAHEAKRVNALLLISPALKLDITAELSISLANLGLIPKEIHFKKLSGGSDILDPEAKRKCPSYPEMSLFGMMQLDILRTMALDSIADLPMPTFLAFGDQDQAIDARASWQIFIQQTKQGLFSKFYSQSKHIVSLDFDRDLLGADVYHFLNQQIPGF